MALCLAYLNQEGVELEEMDEFQQDFDQVESVSTEDNDKSDQNVTVFGSQPSKKVRAGRITCVDELELLRQIDAERIWTLPYKECAQAWLKITNSMKFFQKASLQKHWKELEASFRKDNAAALRDSGTEENYGDREKLLTALINQIDDHKLYMCQQKQEQQDNVVEKKKKKSAQNSKLQEQLANGKEVRKLAASTRKEAREGETPGPVVKSPTNGQSNKRMRLLDILEKTRMDEKEKEENRFKLQQQRLQMESELIKAQIGAFQAIAESLKK